MHKTALIIGASGQDGTYLTEFLLTKNYNVICTSRRNGKEQFFNHKIINIRGSVLYTKLNINNKEEVISIFEKYKPDEVYNLAAQSSVGISFEKPLETVESIICGTINILEAIKLTKINIKFFNAGSSEAYGDHGNNPINEESKRRPLSPYGISKSSAQEFINLYRNSYSIYACNGILFNHESALRGRNFVTKKIIESAVKIKKGLINNFTLGNLEIYRDWGWAPDYVEGMWLMLQQELPDDFILATGKTYSLREFVEHTFSSLDLDYRNYTSSSEEYFRPQDIRIVKANPRKANEILGWKAKADFQEIIERLILNEMST